MSLDFHARWRSPSNVLLLIDVHVRSGGSQAVGCGNVIVGISAILLDSKIASEIPNVVPQYWLLVDMCRANSLTLGFENDALVTELDEQLDEVLGFLIFRIKESIGLVEANDVGTVLRHHHDERPFIHRHVFHFPAVQLRVPRQVSVIQGEHVERQG